MKYKKYVLKMNIINKFKILLVIVLVVALSACSSKKNNDKITSLNDLATAIIAVPTGTMADKLVLDKLPDAKIEYYNSVLDACIAVEQGKATAAAYDEPILRNIQAQYNNLRLLSEMVTNDSYGMAMSIGNEELKYSLDSLLDTLKADGRYAEIEKRWFPKTGEPGPMPEIELTGTNGILKFGTYALTEPFSYVSDNQQIIGFDVEIASLLAQSLGKQLNISNMDFGALISSVVTGKSDIIASCITITEERAKHVLFSKPYYLGGIAVAVHSDNVQTSENENVTPYKKFQNKKIGVLLGSTQDAYVTKNFPDATILRMDNISDEIVALRSGQVDIIFIDDDISKQILRLYSECTIVSKNVDSLRVGFGFRDADLRDKFNIFLKDLKESGELGQIISKWKNDDDCVMPDISFDNADGVLKIGTMNEGFPYTFVKNQKLSGIDIEVATRFAASLNLRPDFFTTNFAGLMPALVSQKVSMICACIAITEERSKQIKFSDPYNLCYTYILAKNTETQQATTQKKSNIFYSVNDLKNKQIGVLTGSAHDVYATKNFPNATINRLDNGTDLIMSLLQHQSDGIILDNNMAFCAMESNPEIVFLENDLFYNDIFVGFQKGDNESAKQFNTFLRKIKEDGTYDEMYNRWIINTASAEMPVIENSGKNGVLRFGTTGMEIPFSYIKGQKIVGFDVELITRYAAYLGKKLELQAYPFNGMLDALIVKKLDVVANKIMSTEERAKNVTFSDSYYTLSSSMIVLSENLGKQSAKYILKNDGNDLSSSKIGVMTGTTGEMYVRENYPNAKICCFDDITDAITALQTHKVKYVMTLYTTAFTTTKQDSSLFVLPKEYTDEGAAIAIQKGNDGLRIKVDSIISQLKADGTLDDIINRWTKEKSLKYKLKDIPKVENGPKLRVGVAANKEPICFISNGNISGLDAELVENIAYRLGMQVEYCDMKFSALIPALKSGKVDLIICGITATEERKKSVDFTQDYYVNPQILLTYKDVVKNTETEQIGKISWLKRVKNSFYNNIILEKRYLLLWSGFKVTFYISMLSAILGTLLGGLICSMRMSKKRWAQIIAKVYIDILRGIPQVVLLMLMFYVVFAKLDINGIWVASITFAMNFSAYVSEMFRTSITSIDKGQTEAGIAMGFSKLKTFMYVILPQAIQRVLPVYKGEFIALVKMTAIVGYIAVQDLTKASDIIRSRTFDAFFPLIMVAIIYFLLAWLLTLLLNLIQIKTAPKRH